MQGPRQAVEAYLFAKDRNQPWLAAGAFADDAILEVRTGTDAIAFPPVTFGRPAIVDVLIRQFARSYENVHTFCLAGPPENGVVEFSCAWLVGMSEKDGGRVRVGCGRYDWRFRRSAPRIAERLTITIAAMASLAPAELDVVMGWLARLPYPWCDARRALAGAPATATLAPVLRRLARR